MRIRKQFFRRSGFALVALSLTILSVLAVCVFNAKAQDSDATAAENSKWNYDELTKAPEKARVRQNPLEHDADAIRAGGKLFQEHCSECHGMKAEGGKRGPSLLHKEVQEATPGTLFWVLTNGVVWHGMPVWSKLPEPQRWQIVTFLQSSFRLPTPASQPDQ